MMRWATITETQTEDEWFDEYVRLALSESAPPLPPHDQQFGDVHVAWFETRPGEAFIHTSHGSMGDRQLAETLLREELRGHGIRQTHIDLEWDKNDPLRKEATWDDVEAKAKRLMQSGNVRILRNGATNVAGHVIGDHGEYDTEFSREDPNSGVLTQHQCECPWDQYSWQRTRQWKKYEGRCCAHVLATYWTSKGLPIDEDVHPAAQQGQPGQMSLFNSPQQPTQFGTPLGGPQSQPSAPPGQQMMIPGVMPGMATGTPVQPGVGMPGQPAPQDIIPPFPMAPVEGTPVNPASVPGLKQPSPVNPVQYPGGTFSHIEEEWSGVREAAQPEGFGNGNMVSNKQDEWGEWVGRSADHGAGERALIPAGSPGEVLGVHPSTGLVNVLFMNKATGVNQHGNFEPWGITGWFWPTDLTERPDIQRPGPAVKRR